MELKDDPILIEEYKKLNAMGAGWSEITAGLYKGFNTNLTGKKLFLETVIKWHLISLTFLDFEIDKIGF